LNLHPADIAVLIAYLVAVFFIGLFCSRMVRSQKDLFLGGRRFGKFMLAFQSFGIGTHSEQVVAVVGQCYRLGLSGIWWQFLWLFSTPVYWLSHPMLRRMRMVTTADYWSERFSPSLAYLAAFMGLFQVTFTIATMLKAMGTVLESVTMGALSEAVVIPAASVLFVFYGIAGGLYAATITDVIQGVLTVALSMLMIPFILSRTGGMAGMHRLLDPAKFAYTVPGEMTGFYIGMLSLNGLVGVYTGPHTMTNLGSGRNEADVRVGVMAGTLMKRFCTVAWAFLGLGALALFPDLPSHEYAFGTLVSELLPPGLVGLMIAGILAAIMSTCDALMLSGAALFTRNLYGAARPGRSEGHYIAVGRVASGCLVGVAAVLAFFLPSVLSGLKAVWTIYAFMGLAWWAGVIWRRTTTIAAWASSIATAVAYWATLLYNARAARPLPYPEQIAVYLCCGLVTLVAVSWLTGHKDEAKVARFYRKMRTPTTVASEFDAED